MIQSATRRDGIRSQSYCPDWEHEGRIRVSGLSTPKPAPGAEKRRHRRALQLPGSARLARRALSTRKGRELNLKLRYPDTTRNNASLNLRNLIGRGLTGTAGTGALAPQTA